MVHFTHTGVVPRSGLGNQFPGQLAPLVDRNTIQLAETGPVLRLFNYISPDSIGKAPLYLQEFIKIGGVMPRAYKEQTQGGRTKGFPGRRRGNPLFCHTLKRKKWEPSLHAWEII